MHESGVPGPAPGDGYFRELFRAVPYPALIVDGDVRIRNFNPAAGAMLGPDAPSPLMKRGGDALHCVHASESPGGCSHARYCADCVVRNSVVEVLRNRQTLRKSARFELRDPGTGGTREVDLLLTAAPFTFEGDPLVLLFLEDISELVLLRKIVPVCVYCKKVRMEQDSWESMERYLQERMDLLVSHSICETCRKEHFGDIGKPGPDRGSGPPRV